MDKITLTKKQFERWEDSLGSKGILFHTRWDSLVAESQKPELIERWAVTGNEFETRIFKTEKDAEDWCAYHCNNPYRIVHLKEVV